MREALEVWTEGAVADARRSLGRRLEEGEEKEVLEGWGEDVREVEWDLDVIVVFGGVLGKAEEDVVRRTEYGLMDVVV